MQNIKFYFKVSNYLEFYNKNIAPKLEEIDIFIKSQDIESNYSIDIGDISKILYISKKEICEILKKENITEINKKNFFLIMANGSSDICQLYRREKECNCISTYTQKQISYIYDINLKLIESACKKLNIEKISSESLPKIFEEIPVHNIIRKF